MRCVKLGMSVPFYFSIVCIRRWFDSYKIVFEMFWELLMPIWYLISPAGKRTVDAQGRSEQKSGLQAGSAWRDEPEVPFNKQWPPWWGKALSCDILQDNIAKPEDHQIFNFLWFGCKLLNTIRMLNLFLPWVTQTKRDNGTQTAAVCAWEGSVLQN